MNLKQPFFPQIKPVQFKPGPGLAVMVMLLAEILAFSFWIVLPDARPVLGRVLVVMLVAFPGLGSALLIAAWLASYTLTFSRWVWPKIAHGTNPGDVFDPPKHYHIAKGVHHKHGSD